MDHLSSPSLPDGLGLNAWVAGSTIVGIGSEFVAGRAARGAHLNPAERTAIIPILGQSNSASGLEGTHTPANAGKVDNLSIIDGRLVEAKDHLLGDHGGPGKHNFGTRLADLLINGGLYDRVILVPIGMGGSYSSDWASGGLLNHRIGVLAKRIQAKRYVDTFSIWHQGENDNHLNGVGTTANINSMIATMRVNGLAGPIFICQASRHNTLGPNALVTAAQAATVNEAANVLLGANTDLLDGSYRFDGTHLNAAGSQAFAQMMFDKIAAWHAAQ